MQETSTYSQTEQARLLVRSVEGFVAGFTRHWLLVLNTVVALFLGGAYVTPALMAAGYSRPATVLYTAYGFTCHQLPQRSYYFFGERDARFATYSLDEVVAQGADPTNDFTLRRFRGNAEVGYKAAIAHRLSALYAGVLLGGLLYALARRWFDVGPMPLWLLALFTLPMAIDGTSHLINDVTGWGFRDTNLWAVTLTGGAFSPDFYVGTTVGTLNWLLRTVTGLLFGIGVTWFAYPLLDESFPEVQRSAERAFDDDSRALREEWERQRVEQNVPTA